VDHDAERIGQRARRYRRAQGKSLDEVAGLAGISKGYLSLLERGLRHWDSRALLQRVAEALAVRSLDLAGQPYADAPQAKEAARAVPPIHLALVRSSIQDGADVAPRPLAALEAADAQLLEWRKACDYAALGRTLPSLLSELHEFAATAPRAEDRSRALWMLLYACHAASSLTRNYGYLADALLASERALDAAEALEDPAAWAIGSFARSHALLPDGAYRVAAREGASALARLEGRREGFGLAAYGATLLATSLAVSGAGDRDAAGDLLDEAAEVAVRTGEAGQRAAMFGPTNVDLHRVSIAVEEGDVARADRIARGVNPSRIDSKERQASFFADWGRARASMRDGDDDAIQLFRRAEKVAPQRLYANVFVRETVADILDSKRRLAGGPELRGLAARLGVL
jgi:transcriptional regulator with XRE-family HTH domain